MRKEMSFKYFIQKTFIILCVFILVFYFMPVTVLALAIQEKIDLNEILNEEATKATEKVEMLLEEEKQIAGEKENYKTKAILREEVEKRKVNEKHYILEDGTKIVTIYPSNIHYKKDGKLVDVDNTLEAYEDTKEILKLPVEEIKEEISEASKDVTTQKEETEIINNIREQNIKEKVIKKDLESRGVIETGLLDNYSKSKKTKVYKNKSNSYKTKFTNKTKGYYLGSLTSEGETITWRIKNAKNTKLTVKNPDTNTQIETRTTIDEVQVNQISSEIEYKDILFGTNINYILAPEIIKENIILDNKDAINNELVFIYETNGLEMKLLKNNDIIVFKDTEKNVKFKIKAPFMYDSNLEFNDQIEIKLQKKNGKYELTLSPNKEWLQAENRKYPVTIDPTIQTSLYIEKINDTFIYKGDTNNTTKYQAHILRVGNGSGEPFRSLIKFTLPKLQSGDQVIDAELSIHNYPETTEWNPPTDERIIDVHKITSDWNTTANWSSMSSKYDKEVVDYARYNYDKNNTMKDNRLDITSIVKDWYTTGNNYGVMLKEHTEKVTEVGSDMYFFSSDTNSAYTNCRPQAIIAYRNQTGLEDYLSYHEQSIGRAGSVYTNDYNGNLVLIHTDTSTPGNRFSVEIRHVYNTNEKDTDIGYGKGIRLNLSQTVEAMKVGSQEYLKYTDEDATAHYLFKNATTNTYEDEDGIGLIAKISGTNVIMTDKSGNTMTFDKYSTGEKWHLKEIKNTENNKITLTLVTSGANYIISKVTDAAGDNLQLTYSSGKLQKITDVANRNITYGYDNSNRLTTITYSDSKKSTYSYGNKNELITVKDIDNSYIKYSYYTGSVYRVKTISEYGTDETQGKSLTIKYGNNLTTFKDSDGYSNTYAFNNYGHIISVADCGKEEQNVEDAYGKSYQYGTSGNTNNKLTLESKLISVKNIENNLIKNQNFDNGLTDWVSADTITSSDKVVELNGNKVLKIVGDPNQKKYIMQEIEISGSKGDIFTLYGWAKSLGVAELGTAKSARYTVEIKKTDGTTQWIDAPITSGTDTWQFISKQFVAEGDYSKVCVYTIFYRNENEIYFDNIGIFKEEFGESYQYDSNGNLMASQDLANQNTTFQYSGNNDLLKNVNPKGGSFVYEYDYNRKGRLLNAVDSKGTKYSFEYDDYGNTTSIKMEEGNKTDSLEDGKTYFVKSAYTNKYFDIKSGSTENNAILEQWTLGVGINQKFTFTKINDEEYYKIIPNHALDKSLYYDKNDENSIVKQKEYKDTDEFKWKIIDNSDSTYRIENKSKPGYVISLKELEQKNGVEFSIEKWQNTLSQCVYLYNVEKEDGINNDLLESNEVYYIKSKKTNLYLEPESDEETAQVVQKKFKEKDKNQLWRIVRESEDIYRIINLGSSNGKALYVKWHKNSQDQLVGSKAYKSDIIAQKWKIRKNDNGTYSFATTIEGTKRYLQTLDNSKSEGAKIVINSYGDQYYLEKANMLETFEEGATYTLKSQVSNLYLGVNGDNVEQQEYTKADTQKWILHNEGSGYYSFRLKSNPTQTMDLLNGTIDNKTNIQVKQADGNDSEKFEIVPAGNENYVIKPKNGKGSTCLDVSGGKITPGANIINYTCANTTNQCFYLTKVESTNNNKYIEAKSSYTSNGNYTTKIEDQLGNVTNYTNNEDTGTVSKIKDAKGSEVDYTYDSLNRVTNVSMLNNNKTYQNQYTYENDRLKTITHNGFTYTLIYDAFGNQKQVKIGNNILITNEYDVKNDNLLSSVYGNNQEISYTYDRFNRITDKKGTNGNYTYSYDGRSNLKTIIDNINSNTTTYNYDLANRVVKEENTNGYTAEYEYDKNSNVSKITDKLDNDTKTTEYNYDQNDSINNVKLYNNTLLMMHYDRLLRTVSKELQTEDGKTYNIEFKYTDVENSNRTTTQVKSIKNGQDQEINYTYDKNGNIETISIGNELKNKYYYDAVNQLIREDDKDTERTITYSYDVGGNILNKKIFPYTTDSTLPSTVETITYTYENEEWKDQLTKYNNKKITYDAIGNPLTYDGNTYTWQNGRQLGGISNESKNLNVTYKYNDSRIRTEKTVNGKTTKYYLNGDKVIYEKTGDNVIYYAYDENGDIIGIQYNNIQYYYKKNIQGDIIGILDNNLEEVVKYQYDSWGNVLSIKNAQGESIEDENHIGNINPYRYRSYRYDPETGLYYLQSRYYNPEWGRFINADGLLNDAGASFVGHNMYAYCANNPINNIDSTGNSIAIGVILGITAAITTVTTVIQAVINTKRVNLAENMLMNGIAKSKLSEKNKNMMKQKLKKSNTLKNKIKEQVSKAKGKAFHCNESIEFTRTSGDTDLYLSVQHASISMGGIKKSDGHWYVDITIWDKYNFDNWRNDWSFGSIANNLGLISQKVGVLQEYDWIINFEYIY